MAQAAIDDLVEPNIVRPRDLGATPTQMETKIWELDFEKYYKKQSAWEDAEPRAFQLILAHCHPLLDEKLATSSTWGTIKAGHKLVGLLTLVRSFVHKHDEEHTLQLHLEFQTKDMALSDYYKQFKSNVEVINTHGGRAGYHPALFLQHRQAFATKNNKALVDLDADEKEACLKASCEEYLAALFIRIANDSHYKAVKIELDNLYLFNKGAYPTTLDEAYRYLQNFKQIAPCQPRNDRVEDGLAFAERGQRTIRCYNCGEEGHVAKRCPKLDANEQREVDLVGQDHFNSFQPSEEVEAEGTGGDGLQECMDAIANIQVNLGAEDDESIATAGEEEWVVDGVGFIEPSTTSGRRVDCGRNRVYLDSCATENVMFATEFLSRCHTTGVTMRQNCNAGEKITNKQGFWCNIPFWINAEGIANLLSTPKLRSAGYKVQFTDKWRVITPNNKVITFSEDAQGVCRGMPYVELDKIEDYVSEADDSVLFVETVRRNFEGFSAEQVQRAKDARDALAMMAHPRSDRLARMVSSKVIENCNVKPSDLSNADALFGPDRGAIRGKTVRQKPGKVRPDYVKIPQQLFERLRDVTLTADLMFVNGLPFFVTLSRGIKMGTTEFTPSALP
jgi:hypothetical protein